MNRAIMTVVSTLAMVVVASTAFAQGRHDEKPHGTGKPAPTASEAAATGGRHDEGRTTHAKKKETEVRSKDKAKSGEITNSK